MQCAGDHRRRGWHEVGCWGLYKEGMAPCRVLGLYQEPLFPLAGLSPPCPAAAPSLHPTPRRGLGALPEPSGRCPVPTAHLTSLSVLQL